MNTKLKPRLVASYDIGVEMERGYSEGKDTGEVNKKGEYKQEKRKQVTRSNRKQEIRKTQIKLSIVPNLQCQGA